MAYINRRSFLAGTAAGALSSLLLPAGAYAQGATPILIRGSNIFDLIWISVAAIRRNSPAVSRSSSRIIAR